MWDIIQYHDNKKKKKQASVSRSSIEAKYKALTHCALDMVWIRLLLKDLHQFIDEPPLLHCDNLSALALCLNSVLYTRIKHFDIDFHQRECKEKTWWYNKFQ